jgi:Fe-S-cluster containining protein
MLDEQGRCTVYRAKPERCTTFPFWPELLESPDMWDDTAERCEGIGEGDVYTKEEIEQIAEGDGALLLGKHEQSPAPAQEPADVKEGAWQAALEDLDRLYRDLEAELPRYRFTCAASGRCCDFDAYEHRLYASTLEAERFFRLSPDERKNQDHQQCPAWGEDKLCHAREGRMLGCRTYFCGPYPVQPPDDLYERYHRRLKSIHDRHGIPFRYQDVRVWAAERRPVVDGG